MIKKKLLIFLLILFAFTTRVYASGELSGNNPNNGGNQGDTDGNKGSGECQSTCSGEILTSCAGKAYLKDEGFKIKWDVFDLYDNSIYDSNDVKILAGTSVGIKVAEYRYAQWEATGTTNRECKTEVTKWGQKCTETTKTVRGEVFSSISCRNVRVGTETKIDSMCSGYSEKCREKQIPKAKQMARDYVSIGSSLQADFEDPNNAKCYSSGISDSEKKAMGCQKYSIISTPEDIVEDDKNQIISQEYSFKFNKVCINVKNGKIRYIADKNGKCNEKEEYEIPNNQNLDKDKQHWHIFFPLNQKTIGDFNTAQVKVKTIEGKFEPKGICEDIIERYKKNSEYCNYIDAKLPNKIECKNIEYDKKQVKNGCTRRITIDIPLTQKFYNEEKAGDSSKLKGFNFYYRPININNPFPNGIKEDSYWYNKDTSFIKDSYKSTTYQVDLSPNEVKRYNYNDQDLSYTSWNNMDKSGLSDFVSSMGIRNSTIKTNSIYNLGCGPLNQCEYYIDKNNKRVKNPMYQPECSGKAIKTGDVCP